MARDDEALRLREKRRCRLIRLFNAPAVGPMAEQLTYDEETRLTVPRVRELELIWRVS